jgi:hypothetical protein
LQSLRDFWDFIRTGQFRFYQERDLGLDLYHSGWPGILLILLMTICGAVFLLAIFHVIPERRHVVRLLLGLGLIAALTGVGTSYFHYKDLEKIAPLIIRNTAGPSPVTQEQVAAVVAVPLVVGGATLIGGGLGCLYMALFWATGKKKSNAATR